MRWGKSLTLGLLGAALGFLQPTYISAQAPRDTVQVRDTAQVALPSVIVKGRSEQERTARKMQIAAGHNDPLLERTLLDPTLSSAMPGVSRLPFRDIPFAAQVYRNGVIFLGQSFPNFGLAPAFSNDHIELEQRVANTITPSLDAALAMLTVVDSGSSINMQPFQQSASYGYISKRIRASANGLIGYMPPFLSQEIKEKSSILGQGPLVNATLEIGDDKRNVFGEIYWLDRSTDLSKGFRVHEYRDNLEQGLATIRARTLVRGLNLEVLASHQNARMGTRIRDIGEDTARFLHQDLSYTLLETSLRRGLTRGGVAAYAFEKTNASALHKSFIGQRLFVERTQLLTTGTLLSSDARVDFVAGAPHPSAHASLLHVLGRFELELAVANLLDHVIAEKLSENIVSFTPNPSIAPQQVRYASGRIQFRQGNHTIDATFEQRNGSVEQYEPHASISGTSTRFSYQWETPRAFALLGGVHRNFIMDSPSGMRDVPGLSKTELKATLARRSETSLFGANFVFRSPTYVPQTRLAVGMFAAIDNQYILTLFASKEFENGTLGLTLSNVLGVFRVNNVIGSYNNEPLLMPTLPNVSFSYKFGKHKVGKRENRQRETGTRENRIPYRALKENVFRYVPHQNKTPTYAQRR